MRTLARTMPEEAVAPAGDRRSTLSVLRRFLLDRVAAAAAAALVVARSLDEPRGDSCGVPIGVAAVRVMTGAGGQARGASTGATPGRDGGRTAAVDGC